MDGGEPVPSRTGFDVAWRGYRRDQVEDFMRTVEARTELLAADRDAAVARVEELAGWLAESRSENDWLRERLDRLCRSPIEPDALQERLRRMLELAREEAAEIVARARAAAEETRAEAAAMTSVAEQRRQQADTDFQLAMAARRAEAMRAMADRRTDAEAEIERMLGDAAEQARRMVADTRREMAELLEARDRLAAQLNAVSQFLAEALPAVQAIPGAPNAAA